MEFNYKIIGEGKPIVFIHGFLESMSMWSSFDLEKCGFKCVLVDLPGHGESIFDFEYKNLNELAQEIKDFLISKNILSYDIVGHSLGGYIALELHQLNQNGKLILFHSNFLEDSAQKKKDRNRVIEVVKRNKDLFLNEAIPNLFLEEYRNREEVAFLLKEAKSISIETIIKYTILMRDRPTFKEYVRKISDLLLIIQGKKDLISPLYNVQDFPELNLKLTNAGHMGHIEDSEHEFQIILNFFKF